MRFHSSVVVAVAVVALAIPAVATAAPGGDHPDQGNPHIAPVVDGLAGVDTDTAFSLFGTAGQTVAGSVLLGPRFILTQRTFITDIGAYVNNCETIQGGVPPCSQRTPLVVQIHPASVDGRPDMDVVIARFELTDDRDPLLYSFEHASMHLKLSPGTYFAMFARAQADDDAATVLSEATNPFHYLADPVVVGSYFGGNAYVVDSFRLAVRILGCPVPAG